MDSVTASLVGAGVGAFGIVAAFSGVLIGQRMARNTQHDQWLRDSRKQECRELLTALSGASLALAYWYGAKDERPKKGPLADIDELQQSYFKANTTLQTTLIDRIFISEEVREARIREVWNAIIRDQGIQTKLPILLSETERLCGLIRLMGKEDRSTGWDRLHLAVAGRFRKMRF